MGDVAPAQTITTKTTTPDMEALRQTDAVPETKDTPEEIRSTNTSSDTDDPDLIYSNAPKLPLLRLFWYFFYNFGLFAWGGPVAQIALIKEQIVIKEKWISLARFQRVFAVYQILPGPEAAELCMFFGCLSAGRIGGVVAGLAFMLPGFLLMLLASYLYTLAGLENAYFNASFRALQPIVAAMVSVRCSPICHGSDDDPDVQSYAQNSRPFRR
jgi:chromate transport protein ChrA